MMEEPTFLEKDFYEEGDFIMDTLTSNIPEKVWNETLSSIISCIGKIYDEKCNIERSVGHGGVGKIFTFYIKNDFNFAVRLDDIRILEVGKCFELSHKIELELASKESSNSELNKELYDILFSVARKYGYDSIGFKVNGNFTYEHSFNGRSEPTKVFFNKVITNQIR